MRGLLVALGVVAILVCILVPQVNASQYFPVSQISRGYAINDWSFMTAWNLASGTQQVSSDWYNGAYLFYYDRPYYQQWIALFIYDDGTGQTRELAWSYSQQHIQ